MKVMAKTTRQRERYWWFFTLLLLWPTLCQSAEIPSPVPQLSLQVAEPRGPVLPLDEAIQIALDNHPAISAARERIGAQQAVLGQQMAAYYPNISMSNFYRTGTETGNTTGVAAHALDTILSQTNLNMILYNFGKREGNVQSARDTVSATAFNYKTTVDSVILGVKQSYYFYLQAKAIVQVRVETVKNRDLLTRQAQGFFEVGTRARIDVARAEANLYLSQADLIAAQNAQAIAWVVLKNAMGLRDLPVRPLTEEVTINPIPYKLDEARELAYASRPELKSFEAQKRAQDQNIAVARRSHLPDIIFDSNYRRSNTSVVTSNNPSTFPLPGGWQVQVTLAVPIFDGFRTTNRVEETLRTYYTINAQEEQQRQQVALDVEQAYLRLVELQERIKANKAAADAAKENLDLANGRYQVGVGNIIEVTDAQNTYTDAQTTYVRALYDYKIADAQLTRAIGQ